MSFPSKVKDEAFVASGRHCCICHKFCGTKIEAHHIVPKLKKGKDEFDNAIPLCFDCHADMVNYDKNHPRGSKYSKNELKKHRNNWYKKVQFGSGPLPSEEYQALDVKIIRIILDILPPNSGAIDFIKNDEFSSSGFPRSYLSMLSDLIHIMEVNPAFEFMDPVLEGLKSDLKVSIQKLLKKTAVTTWSHRVDPRLQTARPDNWDDMGDKERRKYISIFNELDRLKGTVYKCYCNLIKAAQRKLGESLVVLDAVN